MFPLALVLKNDWLAPWRERSEFYIPIAFGAVMLLGVIIIKLTRWPSERSAKKSDLAIDPLQVEELMLAAPPQVVDLRTPEEFRGKLGHLRGAMNIPFAELGKRIDELQISMPRPIVLVDEWDDLSHLAAPLLKAQGHTWLYVMKGGMRAWRREKRPLYFFDEKKGK